MNGSRYRRRVRRAKLEIQGGRCFYCGALVEEGQVTLDHVEPRSRGGSGRWSNLVASCRPCNEAKRSQTLREFLEKGVPASGLMLHKKG